MEEKKKEALVIILSISIIILIFIPIYSSVTTIGESRTDKVREKIKNYLYEKYGEEFMVDRIGTRIDDGVTEYVARIYPKSIIGTNKEGDSYYYGSASVDKLTFGRLGRVGDSYGLIKINIGAEKYLMPKIKSIFGERVLLKSEVKYKKRQSDGFYVWYKEPNFKKAYEDMKSHPEKIRIELQLYLYIFNRIDNEEEKEERRKQIFDFVQYLKKEGLFRHLELGVIFIDERVLAPSYGKYKLYLNYGNKIKEVVEGEEVYLPPMELRKEMSQVLQEEIDKMSEKELLSSIREIQKGELTYKNLDKFNASHYGFVYSVGILEVKYGTSYEKYKKNNTLDHYYYNTISDVKIGKNLEYIYLD